MPFRRPLNQGEPPTAPRSQRIVFRAEDGVLGHEFGGIHHLLGEVLNARTGSTAMMPWKIWLDLIGGDWNMNGLFSIYLEFHHSN